MTDNAAGWQPDPTGKHDHRYWDGTQWTENVSDAGVASTDPYEAAGAAEAAAGAEEPTVVTPVAEDATDAYPTATTPPAAPPPYVPPTPAADGGGGGGGSKRGLIIGGAILAAVALVVAFLALSGDDDGSSIEAQMAAAIEGDSDLSGTQAECVAGLVVDEVGEDTFDDTDFDAEDPPPEFVAAIGQIGFEKIKDECGVDEEAFGGSGGSTDSSDESSDSTDGEEPDLEALESDCADGDFPACDDLYFAADLGSDLEEFGSTCGGIADPQEGFCEETNGGENPTGDGGLSDGNLEDVIADTYQEAFGISEEKAQCLADKISQAVEDGDLTEDQAFTEIFDYLSDCDISLEEIGAN